MKILLASTNKGKLHDFSVVLEDYSNISLLSLKNYPTYIQPEETGTTFKENAILKAVDAAKKLEILAFSDDSGLIVPALNGAPGLLSARYAGLHGNYAKNKQKLLKEMQKFNGKERYAYFHCSIALATPKKLIKCFEGICEGTIAKEERGQNGFAYDSMFIPKGWTKTFAEVSTNEKNKQSHRNNALNKMLAFIKSNYDKINAILC